MEPFACLWLLATGIVDLRDAHLSEKEDIWNGEKRDGADQHIVSEVVESTVHECYVERSNPAYRIDSTR